MKWRRKYKFFILLTLVTASITGIYGYNEYNRGMPDTHQLRPVFKLNAEEILKQFEVNEEEAMNRYGDKTIRVHGIVGFTNVTDSSATVFLNSPISLASIICEFQKDSKTETQNLKKGDSVSIKGICSGYLMDLIMVRCVVDK
jgi:hypothetical protein